MRSDILPIEWRHFWWSWVIFKVISLFKCDCSYIAAQQLTKFQLAYCVARSLCLIAEPLFVLIHFCQKALFLTCDKPRLFKRRGFSFQKKCCGFPLSIYTPKRNEWRKWVKKLLSVSACHRLSQWYENLWIYAAVHAARSKSVSGSGQDHVTSFYFLTYKVVMYVGNGRRKYVAYRDRTTNIANTSDLEWPWR